MAVTPEALDLDKVRDFLNAKAGPTFGCAPVNCGGCSRAAACGSQTGESGKGGIVSGSIDELLQKSRQNLTLPKGIYSSLPRWGSSEPATPIRTSGENSSICAECKKPTSNCICSSSDAYDLPKAA